MSIRVQVRICEDKGRDNRNHQMTTNKQFHILVLSAKHKDDRIKGTAMRY